MAAWTTRTDPGRAGAAPPVLHLVAYADEEPQPFREGTRMRFGRDDGTCEIPIWEQLNSRTLSRVAGQLWCAGGQMWARNLSSAHELVVAGGTSVQVLPARAAGEPGDACSVPTPRATLTAPSTGSWVLSVEALGASGRAGDPHPGDDVTLRVGDVPDRHREAAEALCAPLLAGGPGPATYAQIAAARGWSDRVARRRVEELCEHYRAQIEALPGGRLPGETLTASVARTLVARKKLGPPLRPGGPG